MKYLCYMKMQHFFIMQCYNLKFDVIRHRMHFHASNFLIHVILTSCKHLTKRYSLAFEYT